MDNNITQQNSLTADYHSDGKIYKFRYYELANYDHLDRARIRQVYGVCFYQDKMVIVLNGKKQTWGLAGGTLRIGESIEETLKREVEEESNMQVLKWRPIGVQEVTDPNGNLYYQLRVVCKVKPVGEFLSDPAGTITEIKLINPIDYITYFNWGEIGEKIIQRAVQLRPKL
ncbi:MAG: Phosphohydrolase (MutT/nudix family protein) [Candidatus Daviesbacteria bacterium GW2011_GWA1_41_61]|uniref:Phosphohydrolase (MutT/nudix family protein) n=1 Tax=Candidatus Daviesbacteria bacterium GW2011_GWA2_40_9 TaxID=1618424 RepID=A0A0G0U667_9BACT|nr:MAG: Phosphohydrolase (MutT/nudix family protein) [Candidatus Daviesbacteria bacterium GW2011_GWC1_40_9]KKR82661.1 MAG: Phosphohydrolase (MutT/nudix family protein) [Candidatus Daviesbacteria bacterium GW2011_GWA2_40_9]KKR93384.1 MAG: Phosphohydrolase (MutT/nudix family protein) [Candidatus Daviesbacteria bacterium GW2011_GWB1_41_15]KKS15067.1 MAG: Phosphohydrolase (MutT/nudix family protein) [Candidatus Daviesbacteria bacterium GW2011_GWA1_41_61]